MWGNRRGLLSDQEPLASLCILDNHRNCAKETNRSTENESNYVSKWHHASPPVEMACFFECNVYAHSSNPTDPLRLIGR